MYGYPIEMKKNRIICVAQFLSSEFYMHVLMLIFSKWNPLYHGNGRTLAFKTCKTPTSIVYINFPRLEPNP